MKLLLKSLFVVVVIVSFSNCASIAYIDSNKWISFELPPSQVERNGEVFYKGRLSDGSLYEVFWDTQVSQQDAEFYYNRLMQDFGWYKNVSGNWSGSASTVKRTSLGFMYVNPKRQVAIYFDPSSDKYTAFKIKFSQ